MVHECRHVCKTGREISAPPRRIRPRLGDKICQAPVTRRPGPPFLMLHHLHAANTNRYAPRAGRAGL